MKKEWSDLADDLSKVKEDSLVIIRVPERVPYKDIPKAFEALQKLTNMKMVALVTEKDDFSFHILEAEKQPEIYKEILAELKGFNENQNA